MIFKVISPGIFLIFIFLNGKSHAQTIVKVVADQPRKLELIQTDSLYLQVGDKYVFGESVSPAGGTGPFSYTWLRANAVVSTTLQFEIPAVYMIHDAYSLIIRDAKNCSVSQIITETEDKTKVSDRINVYPVPAQEYIFIDPGDIREEITITITGTSGTMLMNKEINGLTRIEINYPHGIYYITFQDKAGRQLGTKKITVL